MEIPASLPRTTLWQHGHESARRGVQGAASKPRCGIGMPINGVSARFTKQFFRDNQSCGNTVEGAVGHVSVDVVFANAVHPCRLMEQLSWKPEPDTDTIKTTSLRIRYEYETRDRVHKQSQAKRQMPTYFMSLSN